MTDEARSYLAVVLGVWFHTRALAGKPRADEALGALKAGGYWTKSEREELVCRFAACGQIDESHDARREVYDLAPRGTALA